MTGDLERFLREVEPIETVVRIVHEWRAEHVPAPAFAGWIRDHFMGEVAPRPWQLRALERRVAAGAFVPAFGRRHRFGL